MNKFNYIILGLIIGGAAGFIAGLLHAAGKNGVGSNSGSEFWGSEFAEILRGSGRGLGNNSGSKFYGDLYIKEKFKNPPVNN